LWADFVEVIKLVRWVATKEKKVDKI